jgi:hypothetical protein
MLHAVADAPAPGMILPLHLSAADQHSGSNSRIRPSDKEEAWTFPGHRPTAAENG